MAIQSLRPNSTVSSGAWSVSPSGTRSGVTSDNSDATWIYATSAGSEVVLGLTTYTLPVGQRVKQQRVRVKVASTLASHTKMRAQVRTSVSESARAYDILQTETTFDEFTGPWLNDVVPTGPSQQSGIDALQVALSELPSSFSDPKVSEVWVDLDVWERPTGVAVAAMGTYTDDDQPTITFNPGTLNYGTPSQWQVQIRLFTDTGTVDPDNDVPLLEANYVTSSAPYLQSYDPLGEQDYRLTNGSYDVYARVGKLDVAGETLWSAWDGEVFFVSLTRPTAPALTSLTVDEAAGRQQIVVTPAALTYDRLEKVVVQRSDDAGATWHTIRDGAVVADDIATSGLSTGARTFHDYDAPRATAVRYRATVVEYKTSTTTSVESLPTVAADVTHPTDGRAWVYDVGSWVAVGPVSVLDTVTRSRGTQSGVFDEIVGRDTAVVVTSGRRAVRHNLSILAQGNGEAARVEEVLTGSTTVLLKWPDGRQWYVRPAGDPTESEMDVHGETVRGWTFVAVDVDRGY